MVYIITLNYYKNLKNNYIAVIKTNIKNTDMKKIFYAILLLVSTNVFGQTLNLISNINPNAPGEPVNYTKFNNKLYFIASDGVNGGQLWETDGTAGNTKMSFIISSNGFDIGYFPKLTVLKNKLFISYMPGDVTKHRLYATDGTLANTITLGNYAVSDLVLYNNEIYYLSEEASFTGYQVNLNKTDGTIVGTSMVQNIDNHAFATLYDNEILVWNNVLVFSGVDASTNELRLAQYNANTNTFQLLSQSNINIINTRGLFAAGSKLYMSAEQSGSTSGMEPYSIDIFGTIQKVKEINLTANAGSTPRDFLLYDKKLFFTARDGVTNGNMSRQLYSLDTTTNVLSSYTAMVGSSNSIINRPANFIVYKNDMYFTSLTDTSLNLYRFEHTNGQITFIKAICRDGTQKSWFAKTMFVYNGLLYFFGSEQSLPGLLAENFQLWQCDGTILGTKRVTFTNATTPNVFGELAAQAIEYNNSIYFTGIKSEIPYVSEVYKFNTFPLAINVLANNSSIIVSPNPFNNSITINNLQNLGKQIVLMNSIGQIVHRQNIETANNKIALEKLNAGLYYLQIMDEHQQVISNYKLVKQ